MSCPNWNDRLIERLYGEIAPEDDRAVSEHLEACAACRSTLREFERVGTVLREDVVELPRVPRVVVLRSRARFRPALLAASILAAALLGGAAAGASYALARRGETSASPAPTSPSTEDLVQREVDRRLAAWEKTHQAASEPPAGRSVSEPTVSQAALRAELAKFEKKVNGARAADLDYVLDQIAASEVRVGDRIGKTNQALKSVALASNPRINEQ